MRIKDNTCLTSEQLAAMPKLTRLLADKSLKTLGEEGVFLLPERLAHAALDDDDVVLQHKAGDLWTTNIMGFFSFEDEQLTITSRFAGDGDDFFLNYLLHQSPELPNVMPHLVAGDLVDLLPYVFATYLHAAMRKGPYRGYVEFAENSASVRGRVDLARQVRSANWFDGKMASTRRDLTADNHVMRLIRAVIEQFAGSAALAPLLATMRRDVQQVRELTTYVPGALAQLIYRNQQRPVRHAYYHEYSLLQRLALLLVTHHQAALGAGSQRLVGVAFDGAALWEDHLATLLPDGFSHPNNRRRVGGRPLFANAAGAKRVGLVYPDYIWSWQHQTIIADAKYKHPEAINGDDYLQMLAYLLRFEAKRGIFFYPALPDQPSVPRLQLLRGLASPDEIRTDIDVVKLGLVIPQACRGHADFAAQMQQNEQAFVAALAAYLPTDV